MNLSRSILLTILLVAFGTIRSYGQITLSNEAFDAYARQAVERNAFRDSLQLSKQDVQECEQNVVLLQDSIGELNRDLKVTGGNLENKTKWNHRFRKIIVGISSVAVLEATLIYALVHIR